MADFTWGAFVGVLGLWVLQKVLAPVIWMIRKPHYERKRRSLLKLAGELEDELIVGRRVLMGDGPPSVEGIDEWTVSIRKDLEGFGREEWLGRWGYGMAGQETFEEEIDDLTGLPRARILKSISKTLLNALESIVAEIRAEAEMVKAIMVKNE